MKTQTIYGKSHIQDQLPRAAPPSLHSSYPRLAWVPVLSPQKAPLKLRVKLLSHVQLFATPWTADYQAPPSMGFSRQEYWSGLLFSSPEDLPHPGIELGSPALQTLYCLSHQGKSPYGVIKLSTASWYMCGTISPNI